VSRVGFVSLEIAFLHVSNKQLPETGVTRTAIDEDGAT
jgi:hypothetical protein